MTPDARGQVFSGEFLLAYLLFIAALSMTLYLWDATTRGMQEAEERYDLERIAVDVAEQLVRTPGSPIDWNESNVQALGLADRNRGRMITDRLYQFADLMDIPSLGYEENKHLLGIGRYEFYFKVSRTPPLVLGDEVIISNLSRIRIAYFSFQDDEQSFREQLQRYNMSWDLYWGQADTSGLGNASTARAMYAGDKDDVIDYLIANLSEYDVVLLEDTENMSLTSTEANIFRHFVLAGGILVGEKATPEIAYFNTTITGPDNYTGEVVDTDYLLPKNLSAGDTLGPFEGYAVGLQGTDTTKVAISVAGSPESCLLCRWKYGEGSVRYLADNGEHDAAVLFPLLATFNEYVIEFGLTPENETEKLTIYRTGVLEDEVVSTALTLWYSDIRKVTEVNCGDGLCDPGEDCSGDASSCADTMCYEPTCSNGCGQTPVPAGQQDEACAGQYQCDGAGNCVWWGGAEVCWDCLDQDNDSSMDWNDTDCTDTAPFGCGRVMYCNPTDDDDMCDGDDGTGADDADYGVCNDTASDAYLIPDNAFYSCDVFDYGTSEWHIYKYIPTTDGRLFATLWSTEPVGGGSPNLADLSITDDACHNLAHDAGPAAWPAVISHCVGAGSTYYITVDADGGDCEDGSPTVIDTVDSYNLSVNLTTTELQCAGGVDDDCDGCVDLDDSDCGGTENCLLAGDDDCDGCDDGTDSDCGGTESDCGDGLDNDCDGDIDCADSDCQGDFNLGDLTSGWKTLNYSAGNCTGPPGWSASGFDDSTWIDASLPLARTNRCTNCDFYFRKTVTFPATPSNVTYKFNSDDGFWLYVEGALVNHSGIGCHGSGCGWYGNGVDCDQPAADDPTGWKNITPHFATGDNVVGIHLSEASGEEYLDFLLNASYRYC